MKRKPTAGLQIEITSATRWISSAGTTIGVIGIWALLKTMHTGLYLAYYTGLTGYRKGHWKSATIQGYARKVERQAASYKQQLARC